MKPLLSVVIPTFGRPLLLQRAIVSGLSAAPAGEVEVVVVPNGPDSSWKAIAELFSEDPRIRWSALSAGNACAARNHGLTLARGKFVRFLDDDDYLYSTAVEQLMDIDERKSAVCSGPLEYVAADGRKGVVLKIPDSDDFPTAAFLSISISGFTQGSIFLKSVIKNLKWPEEIVLYDDYFWMLGLASSGEIDWFQTSEPVGAYVQHDHARLSRVRRSGKNTKPLVKSILKLHETLAVQGRASPERTSAAATALLTHSHSAFPSNPFILSNVIQEAQRMNSDARPMQPVFREYPWLAKDLILAEWTLLGPRYLTRGYRRASWFLGSVLAHIQRQK